MGISIRKRAPPKPIDSRQLASGTGLRYATLAAPSKTRITQQEPGSFEPISTNRLAPFYSAIRPPIPRHLHVTVALRPFHGCTFTEGKRRKALLGAAAEGLPLLGCVDTTQADAVLLIGAVEDGERVAVSDADYATGERFGVRDGDAYKAEDGGKKQGFQHAIDADANLTPKGKT